MCFYLYRGLFIRAFITLRSVLLLWLLVQLLFEYSLVELLQLLFILGEGDIRQQSSADILQRVALARAPLYYSLQGVYQCSCTNSVFIEYFSFIPALGVYNISLCTYNIHRSVKTSFENYLAAIYQQAYKSCMTPRELLFRGAEYLIFRDAYRPLKFHFSKKLCGEK